jgi:hypothetical protein
MTWQVHVPHHSRADNLLVVVPSLANELPNPEDRDTARWLAVGAYQDLGLRTAGQLLDHLENCTPDERRELLDKARREAGLPDTETVDAQRRYEAANAAARNRANANSPWQMCHADGCNQTPLNSVGIPCATPARKWFCPAHVHLAGPHDMEPRGSGIRLSPSGALVPDDEGEREREHERQKRVAVERQAAAAERAPEAEAWRRYKQAVADDTRRHLPPGVPG